MPILTLTTDWGLRDHYVASFKGELLSAIPELQIVDISHLIEKHDFMQAAFIVQNSFKKFPKKSIHFIGVSGNETGHKGNPVIVVSCGDHFLIGEDTGIFNLILGKEEMKVVTLPFFSDTDHEERSKLFLNVIKKLSEGKDLNELGKTEETVKESFFPQPTVDKHVIRATVIFIDSFGNLTVNIKRDFFNREINSRKFSICLRGSDYNIKTMSRSYNDLSPGDILAQFNQDDYLEISINKNSASQMLGLKLMDAIRIELDGNPIG